MDVIILVLPVTLDTAHIAVAYKRKVSHDTVARDSSKLAAALAGRVSDIQIDDESAHPNDLKKYPVNTAASFTMTGCKQVKKSAPDLRPYLIGYQAWTHIEVVFAMPTIEGYSGVVQFEDPALAVSLIKEPDAYRYDAEIREHGKDLPALPENQQIAAISPDATAHPDAGVARSSPPKSEGVSITLLSGWICGAIVLAFLAMYLLRGRRNSVQAGRTGRTNV